MQVNKFACGEEHLIMLSGGTLYGMGSNNYGALGTGSDDYGYQA